MLSSKTEAEVMRLVETALSLRDDGYNNAAQFLLMSLVNVEMVKDESDDTELHE